MEISELQEHLQDKNEDQIKLECTEINNFKSENKTKNIKKYRSAYIIFCSEIRAILKSKNNSEDQNLLNAHINKNINLKLSNNNDISNEFNCSNNLIYNINAEDNKQNLEDSLADKILQLYKETKINKIPNNVLTKQIAFLWKNCSDNEKKIYYDKEKKEKINFESSKKQCGFNYKYKKCEKFKKPIRFRTPYMFFVKEHKKNMQKKGKFENIEYIRSISENWKKMQKEEKQKFYNMANEDKKRYEYEYDCYMKQIFSMNAKCKKGNSRKTEKINKILSKIEKTQKFKKFKFTKRSLKHNIKNLGLEDFYKIKTENLFDFCQQEISKERKNNLNDIKKNNIKFLKKFENEIFIKENIIESQNNNDVNSFLNKKKNRIYKKPQHVFIIEKTKKNRFSRANNQNNKFHHEDFISINNIKCQNYFQSNEEIKTKIKEIENSNLLNDKMKIDSNFNNNLILQKNLNLIEKQNSVNKFKLKLKDEISDLVKYEFDTEKNAQNNKIENYNKKIIKINYEENSKVKFNSLKSNINNFTNDSNSYLIEPNTNSIKSNLNSIITNLNMNSNSLFLHYNHNNLNKNNDEFKLKESEMFENSPRWKSKNNLKLIGSNNSSYINKNSNPSNINYSKYNFKDIQINKDSNENYNINANSICSNLNYSNEIVNNKNYGNLKPSKSSYKRSCDNLDNILNNYEISNLNLKSECLDVNADSMNLDISIDIEDIEN